MKKLKTLRFPNSTETYELAPHYDNVEGSICSAKISRIRVILFTLIQILSQDYDSVFESLAATPSRVVQIRLKRACLGAVLPVSILEKEICEPSLFGGSWFFFFFFWP